MPAQKEAEELIAPFLRAPPAVCAYPKSGRLPTFSACGSLLAVAGAPVDRSTSIRHAAALGILPPLAFVQRTTSCRFFQLSPCLIFGVWVMDVSEQKLASQRYGNAFEFT